MSPALIRCLLAVKALAEAYETIASKDVAQLLGVKRPTVHRSLLVLQERGLVEKARYGDVHLTETGLSAARELEACRDDLTLLLSRGYGLSPEESVRAAFALMGELNEQSLEKLRAGAR